MTNQPTRIGLMLYTVRNECARDLEGVLRTVGSLGYEGVEFYDLHGHDPAVVRGWLDEHGLVAAGRHAGFDALEQDLPTLAAELQVLGTDRIALNWIDPPETAAAAREAVARIAAIAPRARELGLRLGFHNHWGELAPLDDGVTTLDLLSALPPELLWLELDLGWAWEAAADPVALLERLAGRCPLVHVKDLRSRGSREHCPVGDGAVGYERVLPAAVEAGAEWLIVEQDEIDGPPFEAVERSLQAVRRMVPVPA
jgi:sugar phosphate isomerase/epimerase